MKPETTSTPSSEAAPAVFHLFGRPLADTFLLPIAPDSVRERRFVALIDAVADGLTDQMITDRPDLQPVLVQNIAPALRVAVILKCLLFFLKIYPALDLEAVIPPVRGFFSDLIQRHIRPLSGK